MAQPASVLVPVAVVRIQKMRMAVPQRLMAVPMRVLAFKRGFMGVLVVAIIGGMGLRMLVLQHFMAMRVGAVFGQVQSDAHRHRRRKPGQVGQRRSHRKSQQQIRRARHQAFDAGDSGGVI